jgi:hypothetical protein
MRGIEKAAPPIAGVLAFFSASRTLQDYNNQVQRGQLGGAQFGDKLKWILGMATYRIGQAFGQSWQIFGSGGLFQFPVQVTTGTGLNPWKAINTITIGSGIALAAVHFLPGIPRAHLIKKVAMSTLIAGALGGALDPVASGSQARGSPGVLASSGPARQGATPLSTAYGGGRSSAATSTTIAGVAAVN